MACCQKFLCTCPEELRDTNPMFTMPLLDVDKIKNDYDFPSTWQISLPDSSCPSPYHAPSDAFAMFVNSMELGVRFPLPPFAMQFLSENKLVPAQLHPKGWAFLMGFHVRCVQKGIEPSSNLLLCFFHTHGCSNSITLRKSSATHPLFFDDMSKIKSKPEDPWFLVHPPASSWNAPLGWCYHRSEESRLSKKDLRKMFKDQISTLIIDNDITLSALLEPPNLAAAGWRINPSYFSSRNHAYLSHEDNHDKTASTSCILVSSKEFSRNDVGAHILDPFTAPLNFDNLTNSLGPELPSLEDNFFDDVMSVSSNPLDDCLDKCSNSPVVHMEGELGNASSSSR